MRGFWQSNLWAIVWTSALVNLSIAASPEAGHAQTLPECQPPRAEEYLLLVPNQKADTQSQLQRLLPANAILTPCNYLNASVVRVEGFASAEIAAAWAKYLADSAGLQAYVSRPAAPTAAATPAPVTPVVPVTPVRPAAPANPPAAPVRPATPTSPSASFPRPTVTPAPAPAPTPAPTPAPAPVATASPVLSAYNPQPLGAGFAVVVSFFNQPELARTVRQVTAKEVGLVIFEQQPYLLASHTTDAVAASALLKSLSERGLTAAIIDSRRAMLLTPAVKLSN